MNGMLVRTAINIAAAIALLFASSSSARSQCGVPYVADSVTWLGMGDSEQVVHVHSFIDSITTDENHTRRIYMTDSSQMSVSSVVWTVDSAGYVYFNVIGDSMGLPLYYMCAQAGEIFASHRGETRFNGITTLEVMDTTLVVYSFTLYTLDGERRVENYTHLVSPDFGMAMAIAPVTGAQLRRLVGVTKGSHVIGNPTTSVHEMISETLYPSIRLSLAGGDIVSTCSHRGNTQCSISYSLYDMIGNLAARLQARPHHISSVPLSVVPAGTFIAVAECKDHGTVGRLLLQHMYGGSQ